MSTTPDFDRIAQGWLAEGPTELADRVLDETLREVRVTRQRHPFGVPWGVRPMSLRLSLGAAAVVAVVAFSLVALNLRAPIAGGPTASPPTPSPTIAPSPTGASSASPVAKTPAATVAGLLDAVYAALHARDTTALRALTVEGAGHVVYYSDGRSGREVASFDQSKFDFATDQLQDVQRQGEAVQIGELILVPVRYTYPGEIDVGFDLLYVDHALGGLLVASAATLYAKSGVAVDPAAMAVIATEMAAWNRDDTAGVIATMSQDVAFWDGVVQPSRVIHKRSDMAAFVASSNWFDVANTGPAVTSGPFVALPQRLSSGSDTSESICVYEVRGGKIALQVCASATP